MNLRVAMVTPYYDPVTGGITSFVKGLTKALRARGVLVEIVAGVGGHAEDVHVVGGEARRMSRESARVLETIRPDVIHAHGHWPTLAASLEARDNGRRVPVVFSFHTPWNAFKLQAFKRLLKRADRLTYPSRRMRDAVASRLSQGPVGQVLHPATDLNPPDPRDVQSFSESWGIEDGNSVLAFLGPLHYRKKAQGVADLIRAVSLLKGSHPNLRLVVAGDGRFRARLGALALRGLGDRALLTGTLPRPDLLLARCDLYTHISYLEGLPLAVLEAMALARCVVASPEGGIPDVIMDGVDGVLVAGGPREIASVLKHFLDDQEAARSLGEGAAAKVRREHTWDRRADEFLRVYGVSS